MRNFISLLFCIYIFSCSVAPYKTSKINGVSFVAARDAVDTTHINPVVNVAANYAAIMPFGFIRDVDNPIISHNTNRQWYGETRAGAKQYIDELRKVDMDVMIKPQPLFIFSN